MSHAYWVSRAAEGGAESIKDECFETDISENHIRHCIHHLRQSLICLGGATVVAQSPSGTGAASWDTLHQCKDWN
jgi:hypothetical protein